MVREHNEVVAAAAAAATEDLGSVTQSFGEIDFKRHFDDVIDDDEENDDDGGDIGNRCKSSTNLEASHN